MKMTVFEMMLDMEFRRRFIEKKKINYKICSDEMNEMCAYILSDECTHDIQRLIRGDYFFMTPKLIKLRKSHSNRRREIYRFTDHEILLMKLMAYALHKYDYLFSDSLYSFRMNMRNADLFEKLSKLKDREKLYVLKTDISNYGGNVDPEILIEELEKTIRPTDESFYCFCKWLLSQKKCFWEGELIEKNMGACSGTPLTCFFENIYLLSVDEEMRNRSDFYCRYCDDIAVFVRTEEEAEACKSFLKKELQVRNLSFNEEKTQICFPGESVDLLGIKISEDHYDIADHSMEKIKWKMTHRRDKLLKRIRMKRMTKEKAMDNMIRFANWYFFGVKRYDRELNWVAWAFPVLTREKSLKEIDAHVQECIRIVGSGKKTDAKYRVTYKNMKERGYKNLVYAFYHGYDVMEEQNEITDCNSESSGRECSGDSCDDAGVL